MCSRNLEVGMPVRLRNPITFEHIRKEGTMVDACVWFLDPKSRIRKLWMTFGYPPTPGQPLPTFFVRMDIWMSNMKGPWTSCAPWKIELLLLGGVTGCAGWVLEVSTKFCNLGPFGVSSVLISGGIQQVQQAQILFIALLILRHM